MPRAAAPAFAGDCPGAAPRVTGPRGARDRHTVHVGTGPCAPELGPAALRKPRGLPPAVEVPRPPLVKGTPLVPLSPRAGFSAPAASRLREELRFEPFAPHPLAEPRA